MAAFSAAWQEGAARNTLAENEAIIERGLKTFVELGNALLAIRDGKLYKDGYSTFEEYCEGRWQLKERQAYFYIDAA